MPQTPQEYAIVAVSLVLGMIAAFVLTRVIGTSLLGRARRDAAQTISNAEREAATILKDASTSLKEQEIDLRQAVDREAQRQRSELHSLEKRILAKEESVDKRIDVLEDKATSLSSREESLAERVKALDVEKQNVADLIAKQMQMLESISGMSA